MREIFNPEINESALQEIGGSEYSLPGTFVRDLFDSYINQCKRLRYGIDPNHGYGTAARAFPSIIEVWLGEIRANERVLRVLGLNSEVDQVKQRILLSVDRLGLASHAKLWELLSPPDENNRKNSE